MLLFFIKKNFFDGWDHFFSLCIFNLILLGSAFLSFSLLQTAASVPLLAVILLAVFLFIAGIFLQIISNLSNQLVNYQSVTIKDFFSEIQKTWLDGMVFTAMEGLIIFFCVFIIPYAFSFQSFIGTCAGFCAVWLCITVQLALLWYLPVKSRFKESFTASIKKSFILFFDNTGFTVFMLWYSLFLIVITPVFAFFVPGPAGIIFAWNNALKLRMYKYDWYTAHPEIPVKEARKHIPWETLLEEEREILGNRTLRNLIFPWKD